ncbi:MAG: hypothetical protein Kow0098_26880 [Ignavibacteriaceae bacterium]
MKFIFISVLFFSLPAFLPSCSEKNIIPEDDFVKIYAGLVIQQDTTQADFNEMKSLRSELLGQYGYNEEFYKQTIEYYNQQPERWEAFFDKVIAYVEQLKALNED